MTIAVLGCGWLGLPLATRLVEAGHAVRGSTTTPARLAALADAGIEAQRLDLATVDPRDLATWCRVETLVVTVPPGGVPDYAASMRGVAEAALASGVHRVVFTSSTSVYPDVERVVTEADAGPDRSAPLSRRGLDVWAAEEALRAVLEERLVVLRLAGLVGPGREPGRFLAGRTGVSRPQAPVNLVHQADAVEAVRLALDVAPGAYAICAPGHPARRAFYTREAERRSLAPPQFADEVAGGKTVSAQAFQDASGWRPRWRPGEAV